MPQKTLRILIADHNPLRSFYIEKTLNFLGYYRIAPLKTFGEVVHVITHETDYFDLVIANTITSSAGVDIELFCKQTPFIRHALLYSEDPVESRTLHAASVVYNPIMTIAVLDDLQVRDFMLLVDPSLRAHQRCISHRVCEQAQ